jgi:hypothetical protein
LPHAAASRILLDDPYCAQNRVPQRISTGKMLLHVGDKPRPAEPHTARRRCAGEASAAVSIDSITATSCGPVGVNRRTSPWK